LEEITLHFARTIEPGELAQLRCRAFVGNLFLTAPSLSQHAGLAAMDARDELEGHVAVYRANRQLLLDALPSLGLTAIAPRVDFTARATVFMPMNMVRAARRGAQCHAGCLAAPRALRPPPHAPASSRPATSARSPRAQAALPRSPPT
jgi:hypothetical protein